MKSTLGPILFASVLLYGTSVYAYASPDIFVEAFGSYGSSTEVARCMTPTQDGGFVVTGYYEKSIFLAKFDSQGNNLWEKAYNGGDNGAGRCVLETHDGHLVMVGYTSYDTAGQTDFLLAKFDADGKLVWMRAWGESGNDKATGVIEAQDGTLWVVGVTDSFTLGRTEAVLARIDPSGNSLDCKCVGKVGWDFSGASLAEVFDTHGFCVAGSVDVPLVGKQILLAKFDPTVWPSFLWARRFGDDEKSQSATKIVRTSDKGLALAGSASWLSGPMLAQGGFLLKLDPDAHCDWGRMVAEVSYSPPPLSVKSVIETADRGLVVVGGYPDSSVNGEVLLAKWSLSGVAEWHTGFGDATGCVGYSVAEDADRSLLVAGATTGYGMGGNDLLLARCCSTGDTCIDGLAGPSFSGWSPDEHGIAVVIVAEFTTPTTSWHHLVAVKAKYVTEVCTPTIHTVCPGGSGYYEFIQDAIDDAEDGDIIELCDATFTGERNRDLDFGGKCITVRSQSGDRDASIIDCEGAGRGFYFHSGEELHSIVDAITITDGSASAGGGIRCQDVSPTISDCKIEDCEADGNGGGIHCDEGSPTVTKCRIEDCYAYENGGGIYCANGSATITECEIVDCLADYTGGGIYSAWGSAVISHCRIAACGGPGDAGIYCEFDSPTITWCTITGNLGGGMSFSFSDAEIAHCTVSGNFPGTSAGGMSFYHTDATVENSILWGDCGEEVWQYGSSTSFRCCDVRGGWPGEHIIDADPLFCDRESCQNAPTAGGDYHLCWDSPCAPTNQPICGLIGALPVADCPPGLKGDMNCDGEVDFDDINPFVLALSDPEAWEAAYPGCPILNGDCNDDGNGDCKVDFRDINPFVTLLSAP